MTAATLVPRTLASSVATVEATGVVDFTQGDLEISYYQAGKVTLKIREIGDREYFFLVDAPLGASGWVAQRTPRRLNGLQFPLFAFSSHGEAVTIGRAPVSGVTTTEYEVQMPGGSNLGSVHAAPYALYLWIDGKGRIRRARQTEVETGVGGHKAPLTFTSSVEFTDFGVPVRIQAPRDYVVPHGAEGTT
jgi:hypothetical protein